MAVPNVPIETAPAPVTFRFTLPLPEEVAPVKVMPPDPVLMRILPPPLVRLPVAPKVTDPAVNVFTTEICPPPVVTAPFRLTFPPALTAKDPPWVVMAKLPRVTAPPAALSTTFSLLPANPVTVLLRVIVPPAAPVVPAFRVRVVSLPVTAPPTVRALLRVISPFWVPAPSVLMTTLAVRSALAIVATLIVALSAVGVKTLGLPPLKAPLAVTAAMLTFAGSKSHRPPCPVTDEASAEPKACRLSFDEVSINPPFPPVAPPLAKSSP